MSIKDKEPPKEIAPTESEEESDDSSKPKKKRVTIQEPKGPEIPK